MFTFGSYSSVAIRRICALFVLFVAVAKMPARAQYPPPVFNPPRLFYLALGDSIAYGFQEFKLAANLPPSEYNTGYVDIFAARLRLIQIGIAVVNYLLNPIASMESK